MMSVNPVVGSIRKLGFSAVYGALDAFLFLGRRHVVIGIWVKTLCGWLMKRTGVCIEIVVCLVYTYVMEYLSKAVAVKDIPLRSVSCCVGGRLGLTSSSSCHKRRPTPKSTKK